MAEGAATGDGCGRSPFLRSLPRRPGRRRQRGRRRQTPGPRPPARGGGWEGEGGTSPPPAAAVAAVLHIFRLPLRQRRRLRRRGGRRCGAAASSTSAGLRPRGRAPTRTAARLAATPLPRQQQTATRLSFGPFFPRRLRAPPLLLLPRPPSRRPWSSASSPLREGPPSLSSGSA